MTDLSSSEESEPRFWTLSILPFLTATFGVASSLHLLVRNIFPSHAAPPDFVSFSATFLWLDEDVPPFANTAHSLTLLPLLL